MKNILLVDDDENMGYIVSKLLTGDDYRIEHVCTGLDALKKTEEAFPDLMLLDLNLPDISGMETLRRVKDVNRRIPIVILTAYADTEKTVKAIKAGAVDFIEKSLDIENFRKRLRDIIKSVNVPQKDDTGIIGSSPKIKKVISLIDRFALSDITVLLQGESGTGKEMFAKAIHKKSKRREGPFVPLDCATLTETLIESELFGHEKGAFTGASERKIGKFERAHGGTLFIDEVENLSPSNQAKLLRVIQEKQIERVGGSKPIKVDVRIIAASNTDLKEAVEKRRFRHDLYYRFSQVTIDIPPLRERIGDVDILAHHFLASSHKESGRMVTISKEALKILNAHDWPGNVRELESVMKSTALLVDGDIMPADLPEYLKICRLPLPAQQAKGPGITELFRIDEAVEKGLIDGSLDLKSLIKEWSDSIEYEVIRKVMERSNLNMNMVARFLNIDPKTLRSKIRSGRPGPRVSW